MKNLFIAWYDLQGERNFWQFVSTAGKEETDFLAILSREHDEKYTQEDFDSLEIYPVYSAGDVACKSFRVEVVEA